MATREAHSWTTDQLHALPDDGRRYEAVDGELFVTPSPGFDHQGAVVHLAGRLRDYLAHQPSVGVDTRLVWQPEGASEALTVDLAEFWADVFER